MLNFLKELGGDTLVKIAVGLATIVYGAMQVMVNVQYSIGGLTAAMG